MKYYIPFLLILIFNLSLFPQGGTYSAGPELINARVGSNGILLDDGRIVILGGHGTGFVNLNNAEIWSPSTNTFTQVLMNDLRDGGGVAKLQDGKYLIFGGYSSNLGVGQLNTMEIFNPATITFTPAANMMFIRAQARGVQLTSGKVLIAGCWWDNTSSTKAELYDPSNNTVTQAGDLSEPVSNPFLVPMNDGSALLFGGYGPFGGSSFERVDIYNPSSNTFSNFSPNLIPGDSGWIPNYGQGDIPESYKMNNGKYIMLAQKSSGSIGLAKLFTIDPATKTIDTFYTSPSLPLYDPTIGDSLYFLSPILDKVTNRLYLISIIFKLQDVALKVSVVNLNTHAFTEAQGLVRINYYIHDAPKYYTSDGRIIIMGGSISDNFDPVNKTFFMTDLLTDVQETGTIPFDLSLEQNYPNPFNPNTVISFSLPKNSEVTLSVYNSLGQLVAVPYSGIGTKGINKINFNANGFPSGVYIYTLKTGSESKILSGKMLYLK